MKLNNNPNTNPNTNRNKRRYDTLPVDTSRKPIRIDAKTIIYPKKGERRSGAAAKFINARNSSANVRHGIQTG